MLDTIPRVAASAHALHLNQVLLVRGAFPKRATNDALHLAIATVNGLDFLLTWNRRHLANAAIRRTIEVACRGAGFEPPVICTPFDLLESLPDVS